MTDDKLSKKEQDFNQQTREEFTEVFQKEEALLTDEELYNRALRFLQNRVVGTLATCSDNEPRSTPVRYRCHGFHIYILTEGGGKVHNIKANNKVSFSLYGKYSGFRTVRGLQLWGTAEVIEPADKENYGNAFEIMKLQEREDLKKIGIEEVQPGMAIIKITPSRARYLSVPEGILNREIFF